MKEQKAEWAILRKQAMEEQKIDILSFRSPNGEPYFAPVCFTASACARIETKWGTALRINKRHKIELPKDYK
jgi:hypothetical protein